MDQVTQRFWRGVEGPRRCLIYPCRSELFNHRGPTTGLCWDTHLNGQGYFFAFSSPGKTLAAPVVEKLRAAWVNLAPPRSFDSAHKRCVTR